MRRSSGRHGLASTGTSPAIRRLRCVEAIGVFTGAPLYVWISNQLGNTGVLQGSLIEDFPTTRPFSPDVTRYKPTNVTGAPAASYELDVTDNDFKFPQVWRNNIAVDRRLPWGLTGTAEFIYNKDVNGIYYINANLPRRAVGVHRRGRQAPLGRDIVLGADARTVREPNQQRGRQSGHRRLRHEEPERRRFMEHVGHVVEVALSRPHA